jgi:HAD superfamily hydrolase (TIGR01509 family)
MNTLLFDLDGTLANSIPLLYKVYLMFLHRYGYEGSPAEFEQLNGPSMAECLSLLKSRYDLPDSEEALGEQHLKLLLQAYSTKVPLYEGSLDFLEQARLAGLRLAVVTSAPRPLADAFLQRHLIADLFAVVVTPEGLPKSKPDPAIYRRALDQLAMEPSEGLVFEDSVHGVRAAVGASIPTVRIVHGGGREGREGAVAIASNWSEAWEVVQNRLA